MTENTPHPCQPALEMWGGVECSCVRVGGELRNQLVLNGHWDRAPDLDLIAALGIRTLRYPILWEHHGAGATIDWTWADERLHRLRAVGIRPIVGFVHHGSGPLPDGLLAPDFADELARFAGAVAERYPWIDAYTPVNEPATTARFSGLYGLWHPHGRDVATFGRCFLNECLGTRAAMKAVRTVNPAAQLIQTEDVGKIHSTAKLAYQADYENERRWLTFDVLCGRIDPRHPVHAHLLECGLSGRDLESFVDDPCPPDVLGMNHYVTSERFLDERVDRYPARMHGGNGRDAYADVDAVRVRAEGLVGVHGLLRELWHRYRRPIAITEVQLACTREEQLRWLVETWDQAVAARHQGIDVRAITPWALFGSYDWDSLLVEDRRSYENGAFDVRGPRPRLTAVGRAIAELAKSGAVSHPAAKGPGWWRRPVRLEYGPVSASRTGSGSAFTHEPPRAGPPLLVLGVEDPLGNTILGHCEMRGLHAVGLDARQVDLQDAGAVQAALTEYRPWAVVDGTEYPGADDVESAPVRGEQMLRATRVLAQACAQAATRLVTFSTDLVFDGAAGRPYTESDFPQPLGRHGQNQRRAELDVMAACPSALVIRTGPCFGPADGGCFAIDMLRDLIAHRSVLVPRDHTMSPTFVPDLVNAMLDLLVDGESGVWHLANGGAVMWHAWATALADALKLNGNLIRPASPKELGWIAPRPAFVALASERGALLPRWEHALQRFVAAAPDLLARAAA